MGFTRETASAAGRKGGRTAAERYGREHFQATGRKGFAALARRRGFVGGSRLGTLQWLLSRGKMTGNGPDQSAATAWVDGVLEALDPQNPEVPY